MKSESTTQTPYRESRRFSTPLSVEHLLKVQAIYALIRNKRKYAFMDFPSSTTWFRIRYMRKHCTKTLGSMSWDSKDGMLITMSLNRILFEEETDPTLLYGVIHHEMCHMLLGPEAKHNEQFEHLESGWVDYWYYQSIKDMYFKSINTKEIECNAHILE